MKVCGDCLAGEGEIHEMGCDMEQCSGCNWQLISCNCKDKYFRKREPYFEWVSCCRRCGARSPEMRMVSKEEWKNICGATYKEDCMLCPECMDFIVEARRNLE